MTQHPGLFLAIDQSTSATKAMLFTSDGRLLDQESLSHRQIYPRAGWVEHDAEEIFNNTLKAASTLLQRHSDQWNSLLALSITNQRETFVLFDRETGQPLYNAIVWQCRRGDKICSQLAYDGHESEVHNKTGLKLDTYFPASKLRWLMDQRPELAQKLTDGSALFGTIDTYLIYRLTRGKAYFSDHTNASRTLFYDIDKLDWSQELCQLFGIPHRCLPDIRESSARFGETDFDGLLKHPIPICGVMGDSQAALFAQRCFTPGSTKVTFGSGSSILLNIGSKKILADKGIVTAIGWVYQNRPTYAFEGIINFTGATITWLRDQLHLIESPEETEGLAVGVQNNGGVYFVPAFVGFSAPYWRPDARAAIVGLTPASEKAHIVRAALESIGYLTNDVLRLLSSEAGIELQYIHADGGAVKNRFLMQFVAEITRLTVRASITPELSALGAVFSGALGMEVYSNLSDLQSLPAEYVEYTPKLQQLEVDRLNVGWEKAVRQVLYTSKKE
jgi:glycerol kinase